MSSREPYTDNHKGHPPAAIEQDKTNLPELPTALPIRLAELMAALSIATDLGMGQPMEYAVSSRISATRLPVAKS
jgi:hypothetical protein